MKMREYIIRFRSHTELEGEYARNLQFGGMMIAEATHKLSVGERVKVVLVHPTTKARLVLEADVIPGAGVPERQGFTVQIADWSRATREELASYVQTGRVTAGKLTAEYLFDEPED